MMLVFYLREVGATLRFSAGSEALSAVHGSHFKCLLNSNNLICTAIQNTSRVNTEFDIQCALFHCLSSFNA